MILKKLYLFIRFIFQEEKNRRKLFKILFLMMILIQKYFFKHIF